MERAMLMPRQQYSRDLKVATMREIDSGKSMAEVARMFQVSPKRLETWKSEWRAKGELAFPGQGTRPQAEWMRSELPCWSVRLASRRWRSSFQKKPYGVSGSKDPKRRRSAIR